MLAQLTICRLPKDPAYHEIWKWEDPKLRKKGTYREPLLRLLCIVQTIVEVRLCTFPK